MYLEGSKVVKANNVTALNYFKKSADKVFNSCFNHFWDLSGLLYKAIEPAFNLVIHLDLGQIVLDWPT